MKKDNKEKAIETLELRKTIAHEFAKAFDISVEKAEKLIYIDRYKNNYK